MSKDDAPQAPLSAPALARLAAWVQYSEGVTPATFRRFVRGEAVRPASAERIRRALAEHPATIDPQSLMAG